MVYLTARRRCSTTNLYDSVALSSSSSPPSMIQNGLNSINDYVVVGNHHHHLHDSGVVVDDDRKKNPITKAATMMMLPSKIHPSIRFHKLSSQRLHQSNWTLDHHHNAADAADAEDLFMVDDYGGFDDNNGDDASLLLLSPYSKSCYLMAQRRQSNTANNHHNNTHGNQRRLKLEERATVVHQQLKSSKSMMNLRNHHQQQQQQRPSQPQLIKPPPKRQSSNNNNHNHNHNHNNGTLRTTTNHKKTTTASSTCSSSSATTTTTTAATDTTATQSPVDDEDLLIVVDDHDDDDDDDVVMVAGARATADVEDRTNGRHHPHHHRTSTSTSSTITAFMLQQQQRTKEQILRAKHRASILWLIAKANDNGRIPQDLRDPFYRDHHQGQDLLKPWITQRLANAELYGMALANIYGVPDYSSLGHQAILQLLTRRGVFSDQLGVAELGEQITETMLLKNCPIKLAAHMVIIECIMMLYIREILIPVKVMEVTSRFCGDDVYTELPPSTEPEDVALYWVNRACAQLNQEIARDHLLNARRQQQQQSDHNHAVNDNDDDDDFQCPTVVVPTLEEISDMCDGCSLYALLAFYCPEHVNWREICLKQDIAIADSIYNLQRVQYYCQELFPSDVCFLMLEDFLYLPELIVPNFLAFIADLLFMFEIQPVDAVTPPYLRLYPEMCQDEYQPNYPQMLTPSEMRAKSLKSTWNNNNDSFETSSGGSEYPANHQLYDRPSFTNSQRTSSQLTLNYYQQPPPQHAAGLASNSSRRNSLVNQKTLNRRSSLLSNGSELLHNHHLQSDSVDGGDGGVYAEPSNVNDYGPTNTTTNVNHLSTYFSSMNINSNHPHHSHHHLHQHQPSSNNVINDNNNEYEKNRSRASGGHLTDYFSSLSNINDPSMMPPAMSNQYNTTNTNTHVRAQRHHPNNADNVKQLLSHHHQQHPASDHYQPVPPDSQTNSSDTSSLAEISEFQNDQIKAQLNEKRKQIEADRQNDRQKRAPLDIRQEVLKTLKSGTHHNNTSHDGRSSVDDTDFAPTKNHNDDENLTFEIHELNPIRREKTFTSIPSSLVASGNKTSTFVRKNLFSASEDLKASMSDLNYANAKDYYNNFETPQKNSVKNELETETAPSASVVSPTVSDKPKMITESPLEPPMKPVESSTTPPEQKQTPPPQQPPQQQPPPPPSTTTTVPRHRSQWGQPMIPLAGQHHQQPPLPPVPAPLPQSSHPYGPQPPAWSQTPPGSGGGGYETQPPPPTWYHNHQSPYHHHPMAAQQPSYPYGYGAPPPPPPPSVIHHHGYDPYHASAFMQPAAPPPPPPHPAQDPYMSPVGNYQPHAYHHQIGSSYANTQPGQIANNNNAHMEHHNLLHQQQQDANTNHNVEQQDSTGESIRKQQQPAKHQQQQQHLPHQNKTFFIPLDGQQEEVDRTAKRSVSGQRKSEGIEPIRPNLIRTATQTLVSPSGVNNSDDRIKELYNVRRPSNPPVPPVSFVIAADSPDQDFSLIADSNARMNGTMLTNGNGDHHHHHLNENDADYDDGDDEHQLQRPHSLSFNTSKSEEEMAKKKEAIMKQSLRRRALQESKRLQKEQELAAKREQERLKREQMERKKEEEKEKRAFILDQYKRKKQLAEEIEKNGGVQALQGTVARSSSTLILNRTPGGVGGGSQQPGPGSVTMRVRGSNTQQRPRPKSLHAALLDECQSALSTYSGSSSRLSSSRDEIDDLASHCGRMSSTASCASSRPHSAMSSQLCSSTAISTPTGGGPFGDGPFGLVGGSDLTSGPTSNTFYQEYNGPKLFVKPSQKSNKALILNAINVVLAGTVNADTNRRVTEVINKCDSKYYLILFRNSGLQYRAIYSYNPEREEVLKLDGIGPRTVHNDMIDKFYKYNSGTKSFTAIQTKHLCVTIDAFTIHNHLWMSKAKQQQQQSTPRRFLP